MQMKPSQLAGLLTLFMLKSTAMDHQDTLAGFRPSLSWRSISILMSGN